MSLTENFDRLREITPPVKDSEEAVNDIERYEEAGQRRTLTFVARDGKQFFIFYDDLRGMGQYDPEADTIKLKTFNETITLKGRNLAPLFHDIRSQLIKIITTVDERYLVTLDEGKSCVTEISVS